MEGKLDIDLPTCKPFKTHTTCSYSVVKSGEKVYAVFSSGTASENSGLQFALYDDGFVCGGTGGLCPSVGFKTDGGSAASDAITGSKYVE